MKKIIKIISLAIVLIVTVCGASFLIEKRTYSNWNISNNSADSATISWAKFEWTSGELSGKQMDRLSMNIPCKINDLPNSFTFQFDLGASLTGVYEKTFSSLYAGQPASAHKIKRLRSLLQFWNGNKYFEDLNLTFGNYTATNKVGFVYKNYGEEIRLPDLKDTIHLGTIGADLFKDKILIIDYPNTRFAVCDQVPLDLQVDLIDIELDKNGRVILPMKIKGKDLRIMFDNGSSIFPLITRAENISDFSTSADIDTIRISSWGQIHGVTGKLITDTFELAGQKFNVVKVYANHSGLGIDDQTDAMTGNALFWNKTMVIDFKNKKFGVK